MTIILVILFIIWLDKVSLYDGNSNRILKYIITRQRNLTESNEDRFFFKIINELAIFAIRSQDKGLEETLITFYTEEFNNSRSKFIENSKNREQNGFQSYKVNFNQEYYHGIREIIREVSKGNNEDLKGLEHFAVSGIWFMGYGAIKTPISDETYNELWKNVILISNNTQFVKQYWSTAYQYFDFGLQRIQGINYDFENTRFENQSLIDKRDKERKRFMDFHLALGGLLVYQKNYSALKTLFTYSQQQPPKYVLLPQNTTEIFNWFSRFKDEFGRSYFPLSYMYPFPGLDNLGNRRQVTFYICQYIVLLFLREIIIHDRQKTHHKLQQTNLPTENVLELLSWKDSVDYFRFCLKKVLKDKKLLKTI